jgi:hypothetical protein
MNDMTPEEFDAMQPEWVVWNGLSDEDMLDMARAS